MLYTCKFYVEFICLQYKAPPPPPHPLIPILPTEDINSRYSIIKTLKYILHANFHVNHVNAIHKGYRF